MPCCHCNLVKVECSVKHLVGQCKRLLFIRDLTQASYHCAKTTFQLALEDSSSSGQKLQSCYDHLQLYKKAWLEVQPLTTLTSTMVDKCLWYFLKRTEQEESVLRRETDILIASNSHHCLKLTKVFNRWPFVPLNEPKECIEAIIDYFMDLTKSS